MNILSSLTSLAQSSYYYDSSYYDSSALTAEEAAAASGIAAGVLLFVFVLSIGMYVLGSICLMRIFKKAGVEPWIAWVPFYNSWKLLEIGGQQGFWAVLSIVPVVNIVSAVFMYIAMHNIGLKLGKSGAFVLLAIFLAPVWYIWLAFDGSTWEGAANANIGGTPPMTTPPTPPTTPPAQTF